MIVKYSLVIPVFGNIDWLKMLLQSLGSDRSQVEVVAVNDSCDDNDAELLNALYGKSRINVLVEHAAPRGYAAAVNSGVRNASCDMIMFAHTDVILGPDTLGRLAGRIRPGGPADVASAICCHAPCTVYVASQELSYRFVDSFKPPNKPACTTARIRQCMDGMYNSDFSGFCESMRLSRPELVYTEDGYLFAAMTTRETWDMVGGMDESFGRKYLADRLWVDKLRALGGRMYVDRSTYCHHHGNATSDGPGLCHADLHPDSVRQYEQAKRLMLQSTGRML